MATSPLGPYDAIIALVGITGSGKSTFISKLTDLDTGIGHGLASCTQKTNIYIHMYEDGRRLYLIDTPGFDDSVRGDVEVLREQVYLFAQLYRRGLQLSGIVYLHPITKNRVSGSSARNFRMLEKLCGKEGLPHVVLVSTMWDQIEHNSPPYREACSREEELVMDEMFWGSMRSSGSKVRRFDGDKSSALAIVDILTSRTSPSPPVRFQIQRELVDQGLELLETSAARHIMDHLNQVNAKTQRDLEDIKETSKREETETREMLLRRYTDTNNAIFRLQAGKDEFYDENRIRFAKLAEHAVKDQARSHSLLKEWDFQCGRLDADKEADEDIYRRELEGHQKDCGVSGMDSKALREFKLQYLEEQKRIEEKRVALKKAARRKKRKILLKHNIIPILQILGGATAIGVSIPFGVIPVAGAGVTIMGAGIAALKFSTKDKREPQDVQFDGE